jgi:hypothetical protein
VRSTSWRMHSRVLKTRQRVKGHDSWRRIRNWPRLSLNCSNPSTNLEASRCKCKHQSFTSNRDQLSCRFKSNIPLIQVQKQTDHHFDDKIEKSLRRSWENDFPIVWFDASRILVEILRYFTLANPAWASGNNPGNRRVIAHNYYI